MSVNLDTCVVGPGDDDHLEDAWELKERIRREEDVLKQRRGFFTDAYRRSTVYCYLAEGEIVGFATVRRDGYILFLAVDPDYRGDGIGKRLVARVVDDYQSVSCHARTTNDPALQFYEAMGFETERRIDNYYEDRGDAFYLTLGDEDGIRDRLSDLLSR